MSVVSTGVGDHPGIRRTASFLAISPEQISEPISRARSLWIGPEVITPSLANPTSKRINLSPFTKDYRGVRLLLSITQFLHGRTSVLPFNQRTTRVGVPTSTETRVPALHGVFFEPDTSSHKTVEFHWIVLPQQHSLLIPSRPFG